MAVRSDCAGDVELPATRPASSSSHARVSPSVDGLRMWPMRRAVIDTHGDVTLLSESLPPAPPVQSLPTRCRTAQRSPGRVGARLRGVPVAQRCRSSTSLCSRAKKRRRRRRLTGARQHGGRGDGRAAPDLDRPAADRAHLRRRGIRGGPRPRSRRRGTRCCTGTGRRHGSGGHGDAGRPGAGRGRDRVRVDQSARGACRGHARAGPRRVQLLTAAACSTSRLTG